jgi:hypothetical protein
MLKVKNEGEKENEVHTDEEGKENEVEMIDIEDPH